MNKVEGGGTVSPPAVILTPRARVTVSGGGLARPNQEVVLKLKLLREKVEELKELFSNESYDALKTLTFSLQSPKRKRAGKRTRTKDKASQEASERVVEQPTVAPVVEEPTKVVDDSNGMVTVRNAEGWLEGGAVSEG